MEKPIKKYPVSKMYDYHEVINYIEKKYKIDTRDYAKSHTQFGEWCDSKGYGKTDPIGKNRGNYNIWFIEYQKETDDGVIIERPYQDFWHWVIEDCDISNGSSMFMNYSRNMKDDKTPAFVKEILEMIRDEGFFEDDMFIAWVAW